MVLWSESVTKSSFCCSAKAIKSARSQAASEWREWACRSPRYQPGPLGVVLFLMTCLANSSSFSAVTVDEALIVSL